MADYMISIEVGNGEREEILAELTDAQEKVYKGYNRLQSLGALIASKAKKATLEK